MGHLHSGWTFLIPPTTFPFLTSCNSFLLLPASPQIPSSSPQLLWHLTPWGSALPEASSHETACSVCCPRALPACSPMVWKSAGPTWGCHTAQHFLSRHPTLRPWGHSSPLHWVLPVSQARSIQDTQLPGVRTPHSSGFTHPGGGLWIPSWGVRWSTEPGREVGRGKFSTGRFGPLCPLLWDQGHGTGRTTGAPRAPPSRAGKRKPLTLFGC